MKTRFMISTLACIYSCGSWGCSGGKVPGVQKSGWAGCHDDILQRSLAVRHVPGSRAEMLESPGNPASCPVTSLPGLPTRHGREIRTRAAISHNSMGAWGRSSQWGTRKEKVGAGRPAFRHFLESAPNYDRSLAVRHAPIFINLLH